MSEASEQEALFAWAEWESRTRWELSMMYHIPNGGRRDVIEAAHLKKQGVKPGVPDICLPVARSGKHGLYIEMKVGKNRPTENQDRWLRMLAMQDYAVAVCYGFEDAKNTILEYLKN